MENVKIEIVKASVKKERVEVAFKENFSEAKQEVSYPILF